VTKSEPQPISDADEAAQWSLADASRKAYALSLAAQTRLKAANAPDTTSARAETYRQAAISKLDEAISLTPSHADSWFWRELLARQLKTYIDRSTTPAADRERFRDRALRLLDAALTTAPLGDRPRIGELKNQIATVSF
jgi:hypothetical protein